MENLSYFGPILTEDGIGLASRLHLEALLAKMPEGSVRTYSLSRPVSFQASDNSAGLLETIKPDCVNIGSSPINYFHFSPRWCSHYFAQLDRSSLAAKTNIGYWVCEIPRIPSAWLSFADVYSEIWTASRFCRSIFQRYLDIPVYVVPHPIPLRPHSTRALRRMANELDEPFVILTIANSFSDLRRKNVLGMVKAFKLAFPCYQDDVRFIVKLTNVEADPFEIQLIINEIGARRDISLITSHYSPAQIHHLYQNCDLYLSLHRSEGFGMTIGDAMAYGIPTISTGYSGPIDFASLEGSLLVPYNLISVGEDRLRYAKNDVWADPDVGVAAALILRVFQSYSNYAITAASHRVAIAKHFSMSSVGSIMYDRLATYK